MSSHPSRARQNNGWAFAAIVSAIVLLVLMTPAAFAANPAEEMFKQKVGGGIDPHVDS